MLRIVSHLSKTLICSFGRTNHVLTYVTNKLGMSCAKLNPIIYQATSWSDHKNKREVKVQISCLPADAMSSSRAHPPDGGDLIVEVIEMLMRKATTVRKLIVARMRRNFLTKWPTLKDWNQCSFWSTFKEKCTWNYTWGSGCWCKPCRCWWRSHCTTPKISWHWYCWPDRRFPSSFQG